MATITRTPLITVPLNQLNVGMKVVNENEEIGTITNIDMNDGDFPIRVQYPARRKSSYTADGFFLTVSGCDCMDELNMGIKLFDDHPVETNSHNEQPNIQNNGLTDAEMEAVNILVNKRNMSRAKAILMVIE